jgi:YrbI family 3-deoxy-D-manno-octulosonate 8-phosphate phosphatase
MQWPRLETIHTIVFDFDGVFTDNKVYLTQDGVESVCCDRSDGLGIDLLRRYRDRHLKSLDIFIVSTERNPVVEARGRKLQVQVHQDVGDKLAFVTKLLGAHRPGPDPFAGLIYLGNDLNDLALIERAGFSAVPADAHPRVRAAARAVLPEQGGRGFVRAVIEGLLRTNEMRPEEIHELVRSR